MSPGETYAILGLGLMGGSLARDLAGRGERVLGYDADAASLRAARRARVIERAIGEDFALLREATTVVLAVPVDAALPLLARAAPFLDRARLVTDVGSTKRRIDAGAAALGLGRVFAGSHPMAGDHRSGWTASRRGFFRGARVFVCPSRRTPPRARVCVSAFWRSVGAHPEERTPAGHDAELAFTSHLPHLVALALARALERHGHARSALGPGGRDTTRLAASSPRMWRAIVGENARDIDRALAACDAELQRLRAAVRRRDVAAIERAFTDGRRWAAAEE